MYPNIIRGATAGKAPKAWALPRFWVSIGSYKKQPVKKFWARILGLAWLKFLVAPLIIDIYTVPLGDGVEKKKVPA